MVRSQVQLWGEGTRGWLPLTYRLRLARRAIKPAPPNASAGQIPLDPKTGQIVSDDISEQAKRVLENISAILRAEHLNFEHVVKTTTFLTSMNDFQTVNEIYATYFRENPPVRSTVVVSALPKEARVEIEVIAATTESSTAAKPLGTPPASRWERRLLAPLFY